MTLDRDLLRIEFLGLTIRHEEIDLARDDMAAFGVAAGQRITLVSDNGRMEGRATPFDLPRGSALAYFPEANVLAGTAVDPRSHTPAFKSIPVRVERQTAVPLE